MTPERTAPPKDLPVCRGRARAQADYTHHHRSGAGHFKTGRCKKFSNGTSMYDPLVPIANAMGVTPTVNGMNNILGDPAFCQGPLSGLIA